MDLTLGLKLSGGAAAAGSPPIASGTFAPPAGIDGTAYSYATSTLFTGGAVVTYTVATGTLPSGVTLNASSGLVSGTPDTVETEVGISITGTNADGADTTNTASIAIAISAPIASGTFAPPAGEVNTAYSYATSTLFTGGAVASYSLNGTLPTGLSLNTSTGLISGTPTTEQTLTNISVTGTNATDSDTTNTASIAIAAESTGVLIEMQPISDGTLDSEQLTGSTQPDLVVSNVPVDGVAATVTSATITLPSTTPTVIIFDDFDDEAVGVVPDTSATVGTWTTLTNTGSVEVQAGRSHGKGLGVGGLYGSTGLNYFQSLSNLTEIFISFAYKVTTWPGTAGWPISWTVPEEGVYPDDSAWKMTWLLSNVLYYDSTAGQSNLCVPTYPDENLLSIAGNTHNYGGTFTPKSLSAWGSWNVVEYWLDASATPLSTTSPGRSSITSALGRATQDMTGSVFASDDSSPSWKQINIPGWVDRNGDDDGIYDDIYIADSPVRAMVGNHPSLELCTNIAIQTTTSHTTGGFSLVWRLGDMNPATELLYLFVFDENNDVVNSTGKLLNGGIL